MKSKEKNSVGVILAVAVIFLLVAVLVVMLLLMRQMRSGAGNVTNEANVLGNGRVAYATEGVTIVDDVDAMQRMAEEIYNAPDDSVALKYQNDASSTDGVNFDCLIANSEMNEYDAYFTISADREMTDILYVSGLLRPGQAFERVTLDHPLESGTHTVFVTISLVDDVDGQQTILRNLTHTMDFHVS